jgi:FSR family fosmidomycin resistance protein-like MFS transporter
LPLTSIAAFWSLYGLAHLVVDAICAAVVFRIAAVESVGSEAFVAALVLYHSLAFGLQPIFGFAVDGTGRPRIAAFLGCLVTASGLLWPTRPLLGIVLAGVGNALFHVGGGAICLRASPRRATLPGLFVAPGSLGLLLGAVLPTSGQIDPVVLAPVALGLGTLMVFVPVPNLRAKAQPRNFPGRLDAVLGCMLFIIAVRSLVGFMEVFPWESQPGLLVVLTSATVVGKALGGILADRWGWMRVGVASLLAALPFLAAAPVYPIAAIPGMLLVNLTMPVTLAATAKTLPGRPGFAFGLTSLAVLLGGLAPLLGVSVGGPAQVSLMLILASAAMYRGLRPPRNVGIRNLAEVR